MSKEIKKVIIIGHSGFIGKHLQEALQRRHPGLEVTGFSSAGLDLLKMDGLSRLEPLLDAQTVVVMCSMLKKELGNTLDVYEKNIEMAVNLCRVLEKTSAGRFIYISSTAVYGEEIHNTHISEETLPRPTSYYGMAKCAREHLFRKALADQKESSLLILRPPLVYGAHDRSRAYGPAGFIYKALTNQPIVVWGDGTELREFLYIDDLTDIVSRLLLTSVSGVINVVSGQRYCFKDILDILAEHSQVPLSMESRERSKQKVDNCFDNALFQKVLPDFRFTPLEEGVRKMMAEEIMVTK